MSKANGMKDAKVMGRQGLYDINLIELCEVPEYISPI